MCASREGNVGSSHSLHPWDPSQSGRAGPRLNASEKPEGSIQQRKSWSPGREGADEEDCEEGMEDYTAERSGLSATQPYPLLTGSYPHVTNTRIRVSMWLVVLNLIIFAGVMLVFYFKWFCFCNRTCWSVTFFRTSSAQGGSLFETQLEGRGTLKYHISFYFRQVSWLFWTW